MVALKVDFLTSLKGSEARQNSSFFEFDYNYSCAVSRRKIGDAIAVLDGYCCMRGIENFQVVESSVFLTIPKGNLNAPTITLAEKAPDIILGNDELPASNADDWITPDWEKLQNSDL